MKFILGTFLLIFSCKSTQNKGLKTIEEVSFQTLSSGVFYVNEPEEIYQGSFIAKEPSEWKAILNSLGKDNKESVNFKNTRIDFRNQMLLGIFDTPRSTGGFEIEIERIFNESQGLKIIYTTRKPAPSDRVIMVVTQPYHIVITEKRIGSVTFVHNVSR